MNQNSTHKIILKTNIFIKKSLNQIYIIIMIPATYFQMKITLHKNCGFEPLFGFTHRGRNF